MTVLLYARRKRWPLRSVEVEATHRRLPGRGSEDREASRDEYVDVFRQSIRLEGDLTDEQVDRIRYVAGRCPMHRTLKASPVIEEEVELRR